jgi:integrase
VWWVLYVDQYGQLHREKVGFRAAAVHVYQQRKTEIRQGRFEPQEVKWKHQNEARNIKTLEGCRQRLAWWREFVGDRAAKSGESRVIPMYSVVHNTLRKIARRIDNPYVFPGKLPGSHLTEISHSWEHFLKKADIVDFHWHDFRHTFASRLVMAGANLLEVKKLLGHHDLKMTEATPTYHRNIRSRRFSCYLFKVELTPELTPKAVGKMMRLDKSLWMW